MYRLRSTKSLGKLQQEMQLSSSKSRSYFNYTEVVHYPQYKSGLIRNVSNLVGLSGYLIHSPDGTNVYDATGGEFEGTGSMRGG